MKENYLVSYLKSKTFLKSLGLAVIIIILSVLLLFWFLRLFTYHGVSYTVPDLTNKTTDEAKKILKDKKLKFIIFDSVYVAEKKGGVIIEQHPKAGRKVKKNRKIFLTLNTNSPEMVVMPDMVGMTFREAREKMIMFGLRIGRLSYKYDIAKNVILDQKLNGKTIEQGESIVKGTAIDLVLGKGLGTEKSVVPNVVGLKLEDGKNKLTDAFFAIGAVIADEGLNPEEVHDTIPVIIYQQRPIHSPEVQTFLGSPIDIWVTIDSTKFPGYEPPKEKGENWDDYSF